MVDLTQKLQIIGAAIKAVRRRPSLSSGTISFASNRTLSIAMAQSKKRQKWINSWICLEIVCSILPNSLHLVLKIESLMNSYLTFVDNLVSH